MDGIACFFTLQLLLTIALASLKAVSRPHMYVIAAQDIAP